MTKRLKQINKKQLLDFIYIKLQGQKKKKKSSRLFKTCVYIGNHLSITFPHKPVMYILPVCSFKSKEHN